MKTTTIALLVLGSWEEEVEAGMLTTASDEETGDESSTIDMTTNVTEVFDSFEVMNLDMNLSRGIFGHFKTPSAIQRQAIVPMATGRDMIIQAQSFSGKTSACCIALTQHLLSKGVTESSPTSALIVCPTPLIALQTCTICQSIANYTKLCFYCVTGGVNRAADSEAIRGCKAQVLVATPGHGLDLVIDEVGLNAIQILVLDNANLLLDNEPLEDGGYERWGSECANSECDDSECDDSECDDSECDDSEYDDSDEFLYKDYHCTIMQTIYLIPHSFQLVLVSPTMPEDKMRDIVGIMRNPAKILVKAEELTLKGVRQYYVEAPNAQGKKELLDELFSLMNVSSAIVFCNAKETAEDVATYLKENDHSVEIIHGDMRDHEIYDRLEFFSHGVVRVLVTTSPSVFGIHMPRVSHVFNFDLPDDELTSHAYLKRINCAGRNGIAISLITDDEYDLCNDIADYYEVDIEPLPENLETL